MNITRNMKQTLTRWTVTPNGYGGYTFGAPSTMLCRWEDRNVMYRDGQGIERVSNAVVYPELDLEVEEFVYKGTSTAADPTTVEGTFQVKQFNTVPDLRNVSVVRKAML